MWGGQVSSAHRLQWLAWVNLKRFAHSTNLPERLISFQTFGGLARRLKMPIIVVP